MARKATGTICTPGRPTYTDGMATSKLPWYQFSLRSFLLLTLFVAVLCSLWVCMSWVISAVVGIGGLAGRIVARRNFGFVVGGVFGSVVAPITFVLASFVGDLVLAFVAPAEILLYLGPILGVMAALIGSTLGGVFGGLVARNPIEK